MSNVLKVDWCRDDAALFAVTHWHYSGKLPAGALVKIGVWEHGKFIGCVLFSKGANNNIGKPYSLKHTEICELTRIALGKHETPVSRIVSIALKFLRTHCPGLQLILSYADPAQGHHGGIYQAGNWMYLGSSQAQRELVVNGKPMHKRVAHGKWGTAAPAKIRKLANVVVDYGPIEWKHTYVMPLTDVMRQRLTPLQKPYPKRAPKALPVDATSDQEGKGGSSPTSALSGEASAVPA